MCRSMAARSDGCRFGVVRMPHCGTLCRNTISGRSDGCEFGVVRKPHCGTLCRNIISGDSRRGQENKASRSLPFPLCSGRLSKAPQRERGQKEKNPFPWGPGLFLADHGGVEDRPKELEEQEQRAGAKFVIYDQERWMARSVAWGWVVMGAQMQSLGWQNNP